MTTPHEIWQELAGQAYGILMKSKENAIAYLSHPEKPVRIAAINIAAHYWNGWKDSAFLLRCQDIATTDTDPSVRAHAIGILGFAFRSTRDASISEFLANIVMQVENNEPQMAAYWALREVQLGVDSRDFIKRLVSIAKPVGVGKSVLHAAMKQHNIDWHSADQIDWEFVKMFIGRPLR